MSEMAHHVRGIGLEGGLRGKGVGSEGGRGLARGVRLQGEGKRLLWEGCEFSGLGLKISKHNFER